MSIQPRRKSSTYLLAAASITILAVLFASLACRLPFGGVLTPGVQEPVQPSALSPVPTATPGLLPPALVESDPPINGDIAANGPVTLFFNQPMDHNSVETSLTRQLQQSELTWLDDATVRVNFKEPLAPETVLSIELDTNIRSGKGLSLTNPLTLSFRTAKYLRVVQFLPSENAEEVDPTSAVTVSFSQPVVPLGADPTSLSPAFELDPVTRGSGQWLNTSTYVFYPEPALEGGKSYVVTIDPDIQSIDGMPLEKQFAWGFNTALPQLLIVDPATENPWALDPHITLTFNQPMNKTSVESNFSFTSPDGQPVKGTFEWLSDATQMVFTPASLLPRNTTFNLVLDGKAQAVGDSQLGTTFSAIVVTAPQLSVIRSEPAEGEMIDASSSVALYLTSPLTEAIDLLSFITLEPQVSDLQAVSDQSMLRLFGSFSANQQYVLKLSPHLTDLWGGVLGEDFQLRFKTNPQRPNVSIITGADAIFLTTADPSLIAQAVNVSEIPATVGSIPLSDLFYYLGQDGNNYRLNYHSPNEESFIQPLDLEPDQSQTILIYLNAERKPLAPGFYYLRLDFPQNPEDTQEDNYPGPFLIVVSNIQLTLKVSKTDVLIWAVDLRTGKPVEDAPLTLFDEKGKILAAGTTDPQGVFRSTFEPRADPYMNVFAVLGKPGQEAFGVAISNWTAGIEPWDFGIAANLQPADFLVYLYTDRPIYRPGDTVYFKAIVRKAINGRYALPELSNLSLSFFSAEDRQLMRLDLPLNAFGTSHGQIDLPADAHPGVYTVKSSIAPDAYLSFKVASYRKPEINLSTAFTKDQTQAGQVIDAKMTARYFFDGPVGDLPVHWALYSSTDPFSLPEYQIGLQDLSWLAVSRIPDYQSELGNLISEGDAKTGQDGAIRFQFPTGLSDERRRFTLEVTAQEESGFPVSARSMIYVNPGSYFIGLRPDSWIGKAGSEVGFDVNTVDWQQRPTSQTGLRAELKKVRFDRMDAISINPLEHVRLAPVYALAGSTDFSTSEQGLARLAFTPPDPGTYVLDVYSLEFPIGQGPRSQVLLWVGGEEQTIWPNLPNSRIQLTSDRTAYRPGDIAQVFIPNPFGAESTALVTVERSVIIDYQVLQVKPGGYLLSLPLNDESAPNLVVSVTLLGKNPDEHPDFRQGFINITVEPVNQKLAVEMLTRPQRAGPGEPVQFDIQVKDSNGRPVQGEFSLSVVDLAVLTLAGVNSQDIESAFYGEQPDGVRTSLSLAIYNRRMLDLPVGLGGGGEEETPSVAREEFPDTALWKADVVTDRDGKASVLMDLPDTLTTWQVDVRGISLDTRVGQSKAQIISTKDLLVRPVTPRFFIAGDHSLISAVVQNNTQTELQVKVSIDAAGFLLDENDLQTQALTLPAGGRQQVEWWGIVLDGAMVEMVFSADGSDTKGAQYHDTARSSPGLIPVLSYSVPLAYRTAGYVDDARMVNELISLPRSYKASSGSLEVELSPSLTAAMIHAFDPIDSTPFVSTEQIISRFLPYLEIKQTLQKYRIHSDELDTRFGDSLPNHLAHLLARQNFDGGWSWWIDGNSDPYVTAYALFGLHQARAIGAAVNQNVFDQGIAYLKNTARLYEETASGDSSSQAVAKPHRVWEWDRQVFQQYVMAQLDSADPGWIDQLYQQRANLSPWAQALLALALDKASPGSKGTNVLIDALQSSAIHTAKGVHWVFSQDEEGELAASQNMHTNLSNTAIVLYALAEEDAGSPLVADIVRFLMANRDEDRCWSSTFATAWTLIGLNQFLQETGELKADFAYKASVNGKPVSVGQADGDSPLDGLSSQVSIQSLYPDYPNLLTIERGDGSGRLYYSASLNLNRPADDAGPLSIGLTIARATYPFNEDCRKNSCTAVGSARVGEKVIARLTLTLPNDMYFLSVTDFIPAGAEILDASLKTTQIGPQGIEPSMEPVYNPRDPFAQGWGWWLFNQPQIYDDHIAWTAASLPAGTYELTYTLVLLQPGDYRVLPANASGLYSLEVFGNSAGAVFIIKP